MSQTQGSYLSTFFRHIADHSKAVMQYCRQTSVSQLQNMSQKAQPLVDKAKDFYQSHQKAILIASTAAMVYLLLARKSKKEDEKPKKKKQVVNKHQISSKIFVSDDSAENYKEEPSTTIRVESSGKEVPLKKRAFERLLERVQSSDQQETGDKIFFEMYQQYQKS